MNEDKEKALKNIEKNGCHITYVPEKDGRTCFTYSIGIKKCLKKPELIITGLDSNMSHFLINEYNSRIIDGEIFEVGEFYEDFLEDFEITFKEIDKKHYPEYFSCASWVYKDNNFTALHLIWPDISGALPWEKKATKPYRYLMPKLYK